MIKNITGWIAVAALIGIALGVGYWRSSVPVVAPEVVPPASKDDLIVVDAPLPNALVESPLVISGRARGTWYFEASFPVKLYDAAGTLLSVTPAQADGEWMTEAYVPFSVTLTFAAPTTPTGTLVLEKDNPSGLPQHANELRIPVRFTITATSSTSTLPGSEAVMCTADAMLCPDGSYVGRTGPQCEFVCP